jgi:hypothetical protein
MARKTVAFNRQGLSRLPDDKPVVYKIQTEGGKTNYAGTAQRGRVQERLGEHLDGGRIPGAKVQVQQMPSIAEAQKTEARIIARTRPTYNEPGSRRSAGPASADEDVAAAGLKPRGVERSAPSRPLNQQRRRREYTSGSE